MDPTLLMEHNEPGRTVSQDASIAGRYRPLKKLGRGSLGDLFLVQDLELDRPLSLQTLAGPPMADEKAKLPPETLALLKKDLERLAAVRSPYLPAVVDLRFGERPPFLATEPVAGEPLVKWAASAKPRGKALEEALEALARPLLEALGVLHGAGIVHKDLRPASVLRKASGEPVLPEPGLGPGGEVLALLHPSHRTPIQMFAAPEVLAGKAATAASDLYQLGGLLRFVATGKPPFASPDEAIQAARKGTRLPALKTQAPGLRDAWCQFVDELQDPDPAKRINSVAAASEFMDLMLLEEAAQQGLIPAASPGPPANARSRTAVLVPAALVGVLAIAAGGWLALGSAAGPTWRGTFTTGISRVVARWAPPEGASPMTGARLEIQDREPIPLAPAQGVLEAELPLDRVDGRVYRVLGPDGTLLASGSLPEAARTFTAEVAPIYPAQAPAGAVGLLVRANRDLKLSLAWQGAKGAGTKDSGATPAAEHVLLLEPGPDETLTGLRLTATDATGATTGLPVPERVAGSVAFLETVKKKVEGLIDKSVVQKLRDLVKAAQDEAISRELPEWAKVRQTWLDDPDFQRLRQQGPRLFSDPAIPMKQRYSLYSTILDSLERADTVVAALTPHEPLGVRSVYWTFAGASQPDHIQGELALSSGQGPTLMQYANATASFVNRQGQDRWPERFESAYEIPAKLFQKGKRLRFTVAVEDVSPLYRLELRIVFPSDKPDEKPAGDDMLGGMSKDPSIAFTFYPRRRFLDVVAEQKAVAELKEPRTAEKVLAETHKMALDVPVELLDQPKVKLELRIDKLGIWGGHGATTFVGLFVGEGSQEDPTLPVAASGDEPASDGS